MTTTVNNIEIAPELFKRINKLAEKENTTINDVIEKGISKIEDEKITIPDHLIANKDTYNPDPERMKRMIGIIKTDKPVDVNKIIDEVRKMEY